MHDRTSQALPTLPSREHDSHKGSFGRVLLVGGSRGMAGSISLSGMATLRSGAGLVTVATPRCVQPTVASFSPNYMTVALWDDEIDGTLSARADEVVVELASKVDVVAIGPGIGRASPAMYLVERLYQQLPCPMVVDADGLNALAELPKALNRPAGPRILTPHPGEYARLMQTTAGTSDASRVKAAVAMAERDPAGQTVVVLKGAGTVVADSQQYAVNATGNPGMATGGSGDVLTGIVAAMLAQGLEAWPAARLAVHVHGLAGDLAADKLGQVSLVASDLLDYLPAAFQSLASE
ncbi:NAD(P)H-hydrate dehydratase [Aeoliella mucimassa]|nr:NAD(P)H-hydrate dehydratase [Aeoliella mucimassa]